MKNLKLDAAVKRQVIGAIARQLLIVIQLYNRLTVKAKMSIQSKSYCMHRRISSRRKILFWWPLWSTVL